MGRFNASTNTSTPASDDEGMMDGATNGTRNILYTDLRAWIRDTAPQQSCRVYRSTTQSTASGSLTTMSYSTERWDNGGFWVIGAPTRLTIPVTGEYLVGGNIEFTGQLGGVRYGDWYANGTTIIGEHAYSGGAVHPSIAYSVVLGGCTTWRFTAGDYVEQRVYQNSGSSIDIIAGTASVANSNDFWITWLGA
jgi:hypothetical protein